MQIYSRPDGTYTPYPTSRVAARAARKLRYDTCAPCPDCANRGDTCSLRFVHSDKCVHCCRLDAADFAQNNVVDPRTPEEAVTQGLNWFVGGEMCERSGHLPLRTLEGGCKVCKDERLASRAHARKEGVEWYLPLEPCQSCGQVARRRVSNNKCGNCAAVRTASVELMRANPNMVISKKDAREMGCKVYRTGKVCARGHKGWRYVSTGGCLDCKNL